MRILLTTCIMILLAAGSFGPLYQDPIGALVRDLCIKILWDNLCKISVSGSLCEDPLGHLYRDPALALVQDLCIISV